MTGLALIKVLLLSLSMVGLERLFVVVFLGDSRVGPVIGRIRRRPKLCSTADVDVGNSARLPGGRSGRAGTHQR
jgi:hypothetical protein